MKKIILIITLVISGLHVFSQTTEKIIEEIIKNNTTLKAYEKSFKADSVGNKTDIYLQNPEIGFNYLFGSQSVMGNRADFSVMQTFDFPSAYIYKSQISDLKNEQLYFSYQQQYREVVLQAKLICIDLVYYNLLIAEYTKRYENAEKIAKSYKSKFEVGETNILEYNKAELNKLNAAKAIESLQVEKNSLLNELSGLNGNIPLSFDETEFSDKELPLDFETWYSETEKRNPLLSWLRLEIELSKKQENLNLALSLPKFKVGYMSEFSTGQNFQGLSFGISVPLWENMNKIKYAKLKTEAMHNFENDNKLKNYNSLKTLHSKAISLQTIVNEYEKNLLTFSNSELLYKALEKDEINLINYIMELSFYNESYSNLIDMKRELQKLKAELDKYGF